MIVPYFPPKCVCGATLAYTKADAPAGYVFACMSDICLNHGKQFEVPMIEVREHVAAALLRPKLRVI